MNSKRISTILTVIVAIAIGLFALPKLIGLEQSIKGFSNFKKITGIPNNLARYATGVIELLTTILLIASITVKKKAEITHIISYLLLSATMLGGLLTEYLIRPEPKMALVIIAIVILSISVYQLVNTHALKTRNYEYAI